ncbi:MAG: entericidin A/B family lipoprotein [Chthoniobacterales bacterium]
MRGVGEDLSALGRSLSKAATRDSSSTY